jgi:predicted nuclease of predicted toxin-antitoxin system
MALALYMDHHVPSAITHGLRLREIDVLTAFEDHANQFADTALLDRALNLNRIIFTMDKDFLIEASLRQKNNIPFTGIIYTQQKRKTIGSCIDQIEAQLRQNTFQNLMNTLVYL